MWRCEGAGGMKKGSPLCEVRGAVGWGQEIFFVRVACSAKGVLFVKASSRLGSLLCERNILGEGRVCR